MASRSGIARIPVWSGALSGVAGGLAFAATMCADLALTGNRVNDFRLLAQFGPFANRWRLTGPAIHLANSAALGGVYAAVEPWLAGPGWARGMLFASVENALLWPLVLLVDRFHPATTSGDLPTYNRWPAFGWEALRHVVYGVVLGAAFERQTRPNRCPGLRRGRATTGRPAANGTYAHA